MAWSLAVLALAGAAVSSCGDDNSSNEPGPIKSSKSLGVTRGPFGEDATPSSELVLADAEVERVRSGNHTAALVWHQSSDFTTAVTKGVRDELSRLGVEVVAETSANFDVTDQLSDIEKARAKRPDVMVTLPVDRVATTPAYQDVVRDGTKLVLVSNAPEGLRHGRDYVSVVTDDLFQMGKLAADALAAAIGGEGEVAYFFLDQNSYVTNQRDSAFLETITTNYPDIDVVVKQGIADPYKTRDLANAVVLENPDLDGVYVTFSQPPAEGVLSALRANGNGDTKIVTLDLDEPLALDMANDGHTAALVADKAYELGRALGTAAGYGLIGKEAPPFVIAPAITITKSNLAGGYRESLHREAPDSVIEALRN